MSEDVAAATSPEPAEVAAHTITLRRGTYCIHVVSTSDVPPAQLPGLGISAAPGQENTAVEIARLRGEPWLRERGDAVLIRVYAEQVRLLLTSYNTLRLHGATPPKVEVQRLGAAASPPVIEQPREIPPDVTVHVRNKGDQRGSLGEWVGERKKNSWIEGYSINAPGLEAGDLEYQAVFGKGWSSPWVQGGEFCGSRGLQIPILGLRLRLNNGLEKRLHVEVEAALADGSTVGPISAGTVCATEPLQPVTAIRVSVRPKGTRAKPETTANPNDSTAPSDGRARIGWRRSKK